MSQRSRRFLASKEASFLHTPLDHGPGDRLPLVRTLRTPSEKGPYAGTAGIDDAARQEAERRVEAGGPGFLDEARKQITALTGTLVEWGREHPARMAGAAAALIAVSGLLMRVMRQRAKRLAGARRAVKQAKTRVAGRVRDKVAAAGRAARESGRTLTAKVRSATRTGRPSMAKASAHGGR